MKHYLYMCFLALTLGTTVSCQQAEELTQTLAKDEMSNYYTDCYTDDRLYNVDVYTETKTATINYVKDENATDVVIPTSITYKNEVYTVNKLGNVYNYDGSSSVMESNDVIDVRFCGTFSKKEGLDKESYRTFTQEGSFAQDTQVNPFCAYIYKTTTSSSPTLQSLSIATGGVADDILNGNYTIKGDKLIINK